MHVMAYCCCWLLLLLLWAVDGGWTDGTGLNTALLPACLLVHSTYLPIYPSKGLTLFKVGTMIT